MVRSPTTPWVLRNQRNHCAVATRLEAAFDSQSRRRGFLGRTGLADDTALILAPCNGIHTFFMRFPIDVLFVNRDGRVLRIRQGLQPWRIAIALRAFAVVELQADAAERSDTRVADMLHITGN